MKPDDITLNTKFVEFVPKQISLATRFSRNVTLKVPLVSAAMDTVTEARMAIAMARWGGMGIIHRNLTPHKQAEEVDRVKNACKFGLIEQPICVFEDETVESIDRRREEKQYHFHSFLVIERLIGRLVGVFTGQDRRFCKSLAVQVREVMTRNPVTGIFGDTTVVQAFEKMREKKIKVLPLISTLGTVRGLWTLADVERMLAQSVPDNFGSDGRYQVAAAIGLLGVDKDTEERVALLVDKHVDVLKIDMAHAGTAAAVETVKWIKCIYPVDVVPGNVSEESATRHLLEAGADGIMVGQSPGSVCKSKQVKGTGLALATAVYKCAQITEKCDVPLGADGGLWHPGDIVKVLAIGASFAVCGRRFAGTEESPGDVIEDEETGLRKKLYRGMGSLGAMRDRMNMGSRERYLQNDMEELVAEGFETEVPYVGPAEKITKTLAGGIRKGMFEIGAYDIPSLRIEADFYEEQ
ncbi:MAG: IMP dehydrogenase [Parcubacteria group bacterium Gr01-1014_29]|nr:MAG: IMP dehydrogenase [Parcubacteria group bacterium Gr01-1014_29]